MKIAVKVIPNSKQEKILQEQDTLKVYLKSKPLKGEANKDLVRLLSKYFNKKKAEIKILLGKKSRKKIIEIS